ncbi:hypothetical protein KFK09_011176 [Dendrobium nobile]|uniref:Uncharacterized protein n=1 Tax=Dendrobium nobile TaxID=94219 RepID=A0A8T3BEZ5_DENNO|nr:hypothetical protein KFK09_011176 [Dendrobium nobile]
MAHSLVHRSIFYDVDRFCRSFLWHREQGRYGLHYISWNTLYTSINQGGLGIQWVADRQGPLRARITWNFIQNQNSTLGKIIVAKYDCDIWNKDIRRSSSHAWYIIKDGASFLKLIIRWQVTNSKRINISSYIWILDRC